MNETMFTGCFKNVELYEDDFGFHMNKTTGQSVAVRKFTWRNKHSVEVQVISYGATITSIKIPDQNGIVEDIVMGYDDMQGMLIFKLEYITLQIKFLMCIYRIFTSFESLFWCNGWTSGKSNWQRAISNR